MLTHVSHANKALELKLNWERDRETEKERDRQTERCAFSISQNSSTVLYPVVLSHRWSWSKTKLQECLSSVLSSIWFYWIRADLWALGTSTWPQFNINHWYTHTHTDLTGLSSETGSSLISGYKVHKVSWTMKYLFSCRAYLLARHQGVLNVGLYVFCFVL